MFAHDSILGGFNAFQVYGNIGVVSQTSRPPCPVIADDPTLIQTVNNLNRADFGVFLGFNLISIPMAYRSSIISSSNYSSQKQLFAAITTLYACFGLQAAMGNSYMRLTGKTENGLRWKYRDGYLRKYDFTTEYENQTIWKYFRNPKIL